MDATERRVLCCEALAFMHEHNLEAALVDGDMDARDKLNDVAKSFAKIAKQVAKKNVKMKFEVPKMFTKKEFKALVRDKKKDVKEAEDEAEESEESED